MIKVEFDSADLQSKIDKLIAGTDKMGPEIAKKLGDKVLQIAKEKVPVDTGNLRDSIRLEEDKETVTVLVEAEYGAAVEYGTSRMAAQPYIMPAIEEASREAKEIIKVVFNSYD